MSYLGTWKWAQETNGYLRRRDRIRMLGQGVVARLELVSHRYRGTIVDGRTSLTLPSPPDSRLAREAEQCVLDLCTPALHRHCLRTWAFATLFARRDRIEHDGEVLYLACLLHDLGLTARHWGTEPHARCFAVEGARAAHVFVRERGADERRAQRVAEAISLHLNVTVPVRLGAEAHLLSKGVSLDVIGRQLHRMPPSSTRSVEQRWDRDGFAEELIVCTTEQAHMRPGSRSALLHKLGFPGLVEGNPLGGHAT